MVKEKPGFLTAKAISNRIKSKGLQKLRWFCQMCQKQCRDENGYKCHITSESHHRQMLLFDENSNHFLSNYTRVFMKGYLDVLRRQFGGKRTQANVVYQEYIKDKEHVHMNSTKFTTLTGFINCLHKMGICRVDQTDKGWFIEYIVKDPEQEHLERKRRKLDKSLNDDDNMMFFSSIEKNLSKKLKTEADVEIEQSNEFIKNEDEKITFNFFKTEPKSEPSVKTELEQKVEAVKPGETAETRKSPSKKSFSSSEIENQIVEIRNNQKRKLDQSNRPSTSADVKIKKKLSTLEQMKLEQEKDKERRNRTRHWLHEGILVKLIDSSLPSELQNRNVVVKQVENRFSAIVKTIDLEVNKKMRVQQEHVITVVPKIGEKVLLVNGGYRECKGKLLRTDKKSFTGEVELISGIHTGMKLANVNFDDFSKLFDQN